MFIEQDFQFERIKNTPAASGNEIQRKIFTQKNMRFLSFQDMTVLRIFPNGGQIRNYQESYLILMASSYLLLSSRL